MHFKRDESGNLVRPKTEPRELIMAFWALVFIACVGAWLFEGASVFDRDTLILLGIGVVVVPIGIYLFGFGTKKALVFDVASHVVRLGEEVVTPFDAIREVDILHDKEDGTHIVSLVIKDRGHYTLETTSRKEDANALARAVSAVVKKPVTERLQ